MTEAMIEADAISGRDLTIKIEEDTLLSDANPEGIIIQEGHKENHKITEVEVTADNQGSNVNPDPFQRIKKCIKDSQQR